tara:strand:+ start:153 stop:392 length:240 start_codon:yes stop_codon:yes gene_type:complete
MTIKAIKNAIANSIVTAGAEDQVAQQARRPTMSGLMGGSSPFRTSPKFVQGPEADLVNRTRQILRKIRTEQQKPPEETV